MYCSWYLVRTQVRAVRLGACARPEPQVRGGERGRSRANRTEPLEAGCRAPRQMRRRVSIASVL